MSAPVHLLNLPILPLLRLPGHEAFQPRPPYRKSAPDQGHWLAPDSAAAAAGMLALSAAPAAPLLVSAVLPVAA
ncbi:hypothetical protein P3T21_007459 [Paraburkholderia sp. GAS334]